MAAHIVTALTELAERPTALHHIHFALDGAPWANQLDNDDWRRLYALTNVTEGMEVAKDILPKYTEQWEALDKPRNYEDWIDKQRKD